MRPGSTKTERSLTAARGRKDRLIYYAFFGVTVAREQVVVERALDCEVR
jgi:hypothetical protein